MTPYTETDLRRIDNLIATEIFGWKILPSGNWESHSGHSYNYPEDFQPTQDPAAAMEVLKKCCIKLGDEAERSPVPEWLPVEEKWRVVESDIADGVDAEAETLELAICLFAKKIFLK